MYTESKKEPIHKEASPFAGKTIKVKMNGQEHDYRVEDWWDRLGQGSWMFCDGNMACLQYALRTGGVTPIDNEVLYGKINSLGYLIHISEIVP